MARTGSAHVCCVRCCCEADHNDGLVRLWWQRIPLETFEFFDKVVTLRWRDRQEPDLQVRIDTCEQFPGVLPRQVGVWFFARNA